MAIAIPALPPLPKIPTSQGDKTPAYSNKPGFAELAQLAIKDMQNLTLRA